MDRPAFLAIVGATASGKTSLSLPVAEALGGEIVSVDSRQIYRRMDVGTAKATTAERSRVRHHGIDIIDPDESYSAGRFARAARSWIADIQARNRVPVLVGGTGFFLRTLTNPVFREPPMDRRRVEALRNVLGSYPDAVLEAWVRRLDPERADVAVEGGARRIIRTLEVTLLTGRPLTWWHREAPPDHEGLKGIIVVLDRPREDLYRRIDERARWMFSEGGFVGEVTGLLESGYSAESPGLTAVGYREVVRHVRGGWTIEEAEDHVRRATHRYARRQLTWFRNQLPPIGVHRLDATRPLEDRVATVVSTWKRARKRDGLRGAIS